MPDKNWPEDGLETLGCCPACSATDFEIEYDHCQDVVFGAAGGIWAVQKCLSCGSGFLNRRPTPETIGEAYSIYYTHESRRKPSKPLSGPKYALLKRIRGSYINAHYGRGHPTLGWIGLKLAERMPRLRSTLDNTHRYVRFPHSETKPKLLDVGCGNGDFLQVAEEAGWTTYASDPDPSALELAGKLGSEVRLGGIDVWKDHKQFFDAITMNHVVEHLHNPQADLQLCFELLKPGGQIYIETPNFDAYGREMYGSNWRGLEVPRHLVIFTWSSLRQALKRCGFDISREVVRDNFAKQARRSAKAEAGIFDYEEPDAKLLRMPSLEDLNTSRADPTRSEWIGIVAQRPATSAGGGQQGAPHEP